MIDLDRMRIYKNFIKESEELILPNKYEEWLLELNKYFKKSHKTNRELEDFFREMLFFFKIINKYSNNRAIHESYMEFELAIDDIVTLFQLSRYCNEKFYQYALYDAFKGGTLEHVVEDILIYGVYRDLDVEYFVDELSHLQIEYDVLKPILDKYIALYPTLISDIKKGFIKNNVNYLKLVPKNKGNLYE